MRGDALQITGKQPRLDWVVVRNDFVVLATRCVVTRR
jgi:hypothetical protein